MEYYKDLIKVKILKMSVDAEVSNNPPIVTFELEYPRYIHAELMTHRAFSRNAASSRAIPVQAMIDNQVPDACPEFKANKAGMQPDEADFDKAKVAEDIWSLSRSLAITSAKKLADAGVHKQWVNRILEPYAMIKTIVTATEFSNFFDLRCHPDAQSEIAVLANKMKEAIENQRDIQVLHSNQWHLPYVETTQNAGGQEYRIDGSDAPVTLEVALQYSSACCAQVSYRAEGMSLEKMRRIYKSLTGYPLHASAFEHQAKPIRDIEDLTGYLKRGFNGERVAVDPVCGNFLGWHQYRHTLQSIMEVPEDATKH